MVANMKMLVGMLTVLVVVVAVLASNINSPRPNNARHKRSPVHPHARLKTDEIIRVRGYPAEVHEVTTEDGYILTLHRIPHGRHAIPGHHANQPHHHAQPNSFSHNPHKPHFNPQFKNPQTISHGPQPHSFPHSLPLGKSHVSRPHIQNIIPANLDRRPRTFNSGPVHLPRPLSHHRVGRSISENGTEYEASEGSEMRHNRVKRHGNSGMKDVVFILHGILSSSVDFVMNDPDQALGFIMADQGYDVWLGNIRGNYYGKKHVNLSPEDPRFWDYSWNEVAQYDIPAMLSYVKSVSGVPAVKYIGHSMGASLLFAALHYHPHINNWLRAVVTLAPAAYMHNKMGPHRILAPFINEFDKGLRKSGVHELLPLTEDRAEWSVLCNPTSPFKSFCSLTYFIINGPNSNYIDENYLPVISAHTPAGTGLRIFTQLMQIVQAAAFQAFDYGRERNIREYGRPTPPPYLLSRVTAPVAIFYADNDWVVDPKDIAITASELPNLRLNQRIPIRDFNHVDFLWAENAAQYVYEPTLRFLRDF